MAECPNCKSVVLARDPDWGQILVSLLFFPIGLLFLFFTQNRRCMSCGVRFRLVPRATNVPVLVGALLLVVAVLFTVFLVLKLTALLVWGAL